MLRRTWVAALFFCACGTETDDAPEIGFDEALLEGSVPMDASALGLDTPTVQPPVTIELPYCPSPPSMIGSGYGVQRIVSNGEAFALSDTDAWTLSYLYLNVLGQKLPRVSVDTVLANANRQADFIHPLTEPDVASVEHFEIGFSPTEDADTCWRSQGLTGSADAFPTTGRTPGGRRVLVMSWHDGDPTDDNKCEWDDGQRRGTRLSFVDISDMGDIRYRHVLLVEPCDNGAGYASFCPIDIHAGGVAWVGKYLYVVQTTKGFRVFDTEQMFEVNTSDAAADTSIGMVGNTSKGYAFNYRYVLPQVGRYEPRSSVDCLARKFSWVSVDRSTSPPSLFTGEYRDNGDPVGRAHRYSLATTGKLAAADRHDIRAVQALWVGQPKTQGGWSRTINGVQKFFFVTSYDLLRRKTMLTEEDTFNLSKGVSQNLHYVPQTDDLWTLDEFGSRPVYAMDFADLWD